MAIDNENLEMVELLIEHKVETKDALLHAISEEFVEAVEVLLDHEETIHKPGEPHVSRMCVYGHFPIYIFFSHQRDTDLNICSIHTYMCIYTYLLCNRTNIYCIWYNKIH